ncbi:uncharacterized protein LOC125050422 [Pieris napi]|uniref:Uncharacterized protein n=1 Tax=Pieris macdunnoughi TaxID=345717 RepID=A0A821QPH8_9NEOP|nr:uncharacterized protein LOC125050422 [Pieris napi]CAF4824881.1 unnamed protein product [Pieris macdunnoughi]
MESINEEIQANLPDPPDEETEIKLRPLERIKLNPKVPPEPSAYGKGKNFSRPWILQDGREVPKSGSEMRESFCVPKKPPKGEGIRKRMLKDFFWEQMLDEVIEELATSQPVADYCTEYESNFIKEQFEPRNLEITADKNMHLKYPLYGTGSSAITYYSESVKKTGPGEILEKFRRCQYFTKPMEERLDNGWVL